jgi:hypothetical protein
MKKIPSQNASDKEYNLPITLAGSKNIEHRLKFLSELLSQSEDKINHIDKSRQTNMNYALLIFAGLFGVGVGLDNMVYKLAISTAIVLLMCIFCLWDRRLHKISHGWQSSNKTYCEMSAEVINKPTKDISFPRYSTDNEKNAEWFSFQPVVFYALVLGGLLLFLIFLFV